LIGWSAGMGFRRFLVRRAFNMAVILSLTVLLTIAILGPSADAILRRAVEQETRAEILQNKELVGKFKDPGSLEGYVKSQIRGKIASMGLDDPWYSPRRLWTIAVKVMALDFGQSYYIRSYGGSSNVRDIILEALPRTILLFGTATLIVAALGILVGAAAARRAGSPLDKAVLGYAVLSNSFPLWWIGMLAILLFAYTLRIFPARATPAIPPTDPAYPLALLYHMALPLATMVLMGFGGWAYVVRNLMIGILQEDYIAVAKAKGVPERKILYGHALRSAAPPIVTIVALALSSSFGGAMITEAVFDWPGLGRLYWEAISSLDVPVILGLTYVSTLIFLLSVFIADVLYGLFDPRVRVG
jgi:peptide/nickel transport system permease protein